MISVIIILAFKKLMFPQFKFPHYTTSARHIFFPCGNLKGILKSKFLLTINYLFNAI